MAQARFHARDEFESWAYDLEQHLSASLGQEFSGVAIHPTQNTMYVGTASTGESEMAALSAADLAGNYEIVLVSVSTTVAERAYVANQLTEAGVATYGVMTLDDSVRLSVDDAAAAARAGEALGIPELADVVDDLAENQSVRVRELTVSRVEMVDGKDSLSSGVSNSRADGSAYCTFGPNVVEISTGVRYATTSGHCDDGVWRNGQFFARREGLETPTEDWAVHHIPSVIAPALGWVWVSSSSSIPIHGPWRSHMSGSVRNMKGRVSGYSTGVYVGTFCGRPAASYNRAPGDSGGPVVYHYGTPRIAGLHRGACTYYDTTTSTVVHWATYSPVYALELGGGTTPQYRILEHDE